MINHYDPNQPRVPAGHHDGGQWTDGGFSPGDAKFTSADRPGLLNAVLGAHGGDGRAGPAQLAFLDTPKPPAPIQLPLPKPIPRIPLTPGISAFSRLLPYLGSALTLYSLLSSLNDDEQQAIISFRSREFRRGEPKRFHLEGVQLLTQQEARDICGEYFEKVQELTDRAFDELKKDRKSLSPQDFGSKVHKRVEDLINEFKGKKINNDKLQAERSFAKGDGSDRTGAKDTVRLDVYNRVDDKTVCIDDIKTGRSGLSYSRMRELAESVSNKDPDVERIIVTEVRPKGLRPPRPRPLTLQGD